MISNLFIWLSKSMEASVLIALAASFIWGILSLILSPCHLAGIPLLTGYLSRQEKLKSHSSFKLSILFASGLILSIAILGIITSMLGLILGDTGIYGKYLLSLILIAAGLNLAGIIPLPFSPVSGKPGAGKGLWGAMIFGLVFGLVLGPCSFAFMAPVLGAAFKAADANIIYAFVLVLAYGLGHSFLIIIAGTSTELVQKYLKWHEDHRSGKIFRIICGIVVSTAGIYNLIK